MSPRHLLLNLVAFALMAILLDLVDVATAIILPVAGGLFVNTILLGYGLPAVLAIILALIARTTRPIS